MKVIKQDCAILEFPSSSVAMVHNNQSGYSLLMVDENYEFASIEIRLSGAQALSITEAVMADIEAGIFRG